MKSFRWKKNSIHAMEILGMSSYTDSSKLIQYGPDSYE